MCGIAWYASKRALKSNADNMRTKTTARAFAFYSLPELYDWENGTQLPDDWSGECTVYGMPGNIPGVVFNTHKEGIERHWQYVREAGIDS